MIDTPLGRTSEVPPAFYRDAAPPPPPDDPHRHEWWHHDGEDRPPAWRFWSAVLRPCSYGLVLSILLSALFIAMNTIPDFGMAHPRTFAARLVAVVRDNLAGRISQG